MNVCRIRTARRRTPSTSGGSRPAGAAGATIVSAANRRDSVPATSARFTVACHRRVESTPRMRRRRPTERATDDLAIVFRSPVSELRRLNGVRPSRIWLREYRVRQSNVFNILVKTPSGPAPAVASFDPQPFLTAASQLLHLRGSNFQQGLRVGRGGRQQPLVLAGEFRRRLRDGDARSSVAAPSGRVQIQNADGQVSNILRFAGNPLPLQRSASGGPFYRVRLAANHRACCQSQNPD